LGPDGKVLPAVREVLKVCAQQKLVVHTGHMSAKEVLVFAAAARDAGVERIVVTHGQFEVVNMSLDEMKQAARMGVKMELCAMGFMMGPNAQQAWMRHWREVTIKETAERVKAVGAEHFVLGTDLGQANNPTPPDGLGSFVNGLMKEGLSKAQIMTMGREVPGKLLMG
jgi:predicted peroxiredoxin